MKKLILSLLGTVLVLVSAALVLYPFISNYLMSLNQEAEISAYDSVIDSTDAEIKAQALEDAREYNKTFYGHVVITDPFDPNYQPVFDKEYDSLLNLNGDGIMGYVSIPSIGVYLPIYHGTDDEVLARGAGHLQSTSLPVGGVGTHAVLTGHTGLTSARLFTDINQLKAMETDEDGNVISDGDVFYIKVLDEILAYEVDQIKVVEPSETDDLKIDPDEDYVTLVTCTPYGINSHRLLVRGTRIPYEEAQRIEKESGDTVVESTWMAEYRRALIAGAALLGVLIFAIVLVITIRRRVKKKRSSRAAPPPDSH